jgi:hypothetical protein
MTILHEAVLISGVYVAGCLTGHRVVTVVKAEFAKLHDKLDSLLAKKVNTVRPLSK